MIESQDGQLAPAVTKRRRDPLGRAIQVLVHMVDGGEDAYGVRDLGARLGLSASTAHRLLTELEQLGMVERTPTGSYRVGLEFLRIARTAAARSPLHDKANDVLSELTQVSGETSFLGVYSSQRQQMMFSMSVESSHPLRYVLRLNHWLPVHSGASGLAILAFLPAADQLAVLRGGLAALTAHTMVDSDRLASRLAEIRRLGYASSHAERIVGAVAVAAPVFAPGGRVFGDVGVTIPESRFDAAAGEHLAERVMRSAQILTDALGGIKPTY